MLQLPLHALRVPLFIATWRNSANFQAQTPNEWSAFTWNRLGASYLDAFPSHSCSRLVGIASLILTLFFGAPITVLERSMALTPSALAMLWHECFSIPASFLLTNVSSHKSTGQFIITALSLLNPAPVFGLVLISTHILSVGSHSTTMSLCLMWSVIKKPGFDVLRAFTARHLSIVFK